MPPPSDLQPDHQLAARQPAATVFLPQTVDFADRSDADWSATADVQSKSVFNHYSLTFASAPLREVTEFDGLFSGQLDFTANKMDLDLTLALYERFPDGTYLKLFDPPDEFRASYVQDRSHRHLLSAGVRQRLSFHSERLLSRRFEPGSRLVLILSVNKRADQELNYGSGQAVSVESIADANTPLTRRWYANSYIERPIQLSAPHNGQARGH